MNDNHPPPRPSRERPRPPIDAAVLDAIKKLDAYLFATPAGNDDEADMQLLDAVRRRCWLAGAEFDE